MILAYSEPDHQPYASTRNGLADLRCQPLDQAKPLTGARLSTPLTRSLQTICLAHLPGLGAHRCHGAGYDHGVRHLAYNGHRGRLAKYVRRRRVEIDASTAGDVLYLDKSASPLRGLLAVRKRAAVFPPPVVPPTGPQPDPDETESGICCIHVECLSKA